MQQRRWYLDDRDIPDSDRVALSHLDELFAIMSPLYRGQGVRTQMTPEQWISFEEKYDAAPAQEDEEVESRYIVSDHVEEERTATPTPQDIHDLMAQLDQLRLAARAPDEEPEDIMEDCNQMFAEINEKP